MERAQLGELLASKLGHLPVGGDPDFHIAVSTDNESEWQFSRFVSSPPYRSLVLAQADAVDSRLIDKVDGFQIDILECSRVCPRSSLGRFGWDGEQPGSYRWWDNYHWK